MNKHIKLLIILVVSVVVVLGGIFAIIKIRQNNTEPIVPPTPTPVAIVEATPTPTPAEVTPTVEPTPTPTPSPTPKVILEKMAEYYEANEDTVGWMTIPGTKTDNQVMQGEDNSYYLYHTPVHTRTVAASLFMDYKLESQELSRNVVVYGHNMRDGSMFGDLDRYRSEDYYNENKIIYYSTLYEEYEFEIINAFVTDVNFYYIQTNFNNDDEFVDLMNQCLERSLYPDDSIVISPDDVILTLSTCAYDFDNARFVIQARMIKD